MKISNSKKELARIISENGGWRDGEFAGQEQTGHICFLRASDLTECHEALSRAEYFHLHPAPDADGWIEYSGKGSPYADHEVVEAKWSDGDFTCSDNFGPGYAWIVKYGEPNITHHRPHNPEQAKPEFCESVARSIPEPEYKPSIEQLMQIHCDRAHALSKKKAELIVAERQELEVLGALKAACKEAGFDISPIERLPGKQETRDGDYRLARFAAWRHHPGCSIR